MLSIIALAAICLASAVSSAPLTYVTVANGTYNGAYSPVFNVDQFLGIPYAQPPVGNLRFAHPKSLNSTWSGVKNVTDYAPACIGFGASSNGVPQSEDCLHLNVIRPNGTSGYDKLPVLFWIFGGGNTQGTARDPRYNGSYIVQKSVALGKPIIFVSLDYRLSGYGFLGSDELAAEGSLNSGLRDQNLALHWVQENITPFGGDPKKVVIWGQSAGGQDVISHVLAFGGRDDNLFRGAIIHSGTTFTANATLAALKPNYQLVLNKAGCNNATSGLACLRSLPAANYTAAINGTISSGPVPDLDFIVGRPLDSIKGGKYIDVPLIITAVQDEATQLGPPTGIMNDTAFLNTVKNVYTARTNIANGTLDGALTAFPNDPTVGCPYNTGEGVLPTGIQDKRVASYSTDTTHAGRRLMCGIKKTSERYASHFVQIPQNGTMELGVGHFYDMPYYFGVTDTATTPRNPLGNRPADLRTVAAMQEYYINFVYDLAPSVKNGTAWPAYSNGQKVLTIKNDAISADPDTYRSKQMEFINSLN